MPQRSGPSWERTWDLFHAALDTDPGEREAWLREACGRDAELCREVLELLRAHEEPLELLESPTVLRAAADLPDTALAEDEEPTGPLPGTVLCDRFEIVRLLGKGGMGTVHQAHDRELGARVAVKVLRPSLARDASTRQRFRREVQLARRVTHPNACRIFDLFEHAEPEGESTVFLVMELLEGETLAERIEREGALREPLALEIFEQVAAAVSAAHRQGVVHRDLKSANVFLAADAETQRAVVMDFGIAMSLVETEESLRMTRVGQLVGSPSTMAPEQLTAGEITPRTDVHALGQLLFEMLAGRLPFVGRSVLEAAVGRLHRPAPPLRSFAPTVSARIERVVGQSLSLRPEDRPESPEALVERLRGGGGSPPLAAHAAWIGSGLTAMLFLAWLLQLGKAHPGHEEGSGGIDPRSTASGPAAVGGSGRTPSVSGATTAADGKPLLAVLPFEDRSGPGGEDGADESFADGISASLISELSSFPELSVISWASTAPFRGSGLGAPEIAEALGVRHIVSGSVQREGDRFRVDAELIDARDGRLASSSSSEGSIGDLFFLQRELAGKLVRELPLASPPTALAPAPSTSLALPAAQDEYLKALYLWRWAWLHLHEDADRQWYAELDEKTARAAEHLRSALELSPDFAPAIALLAHVQRRLGEVDAAAASARRAVELDPRLPEALVAHAVCVHVEEHSWGAARADLEKALRLRPGDESARRWLAWVLQVVGRSDEAVATVEHALRLSPQDVSLQFELGMTLYRARRFDEAAERLSVVSELFPTSYAAHFYLAKALVHAGRVEEAFAAMQQCCKTHRCWYTTSILLAHSSSWTLAEHLLEPRGRQLKGIPRFMAELSALAGEDDLAIRHLERDERDRPDPISHALGWVWPPLLVQEPPFDHLRGHPDLEALACRLALPSCGANPEGGG